MSLYNNFNEDTNADVMWKKIGFIFENKKRRKQGLSLQKDSEIEVSGWLTHG